MDKSLHPAATHHLPGFITAPGETDWLMVVAALVLLGGTIAFGVIYLILITMPARWLHPSRKLQYQIVTVLGLLALLSQMHFFWVAGLLLALVDFPDLGGWLDRITGLVERIADKSSRGPRRVIERNEAHPPARNITNFRRADGGSSAAR